uniref:hypothetical protein n=1 Tax=Pleurosigma intermedium TaxID=197753 RepID=UPI0021820BAB|nr:hypothetical protein N4L43_pgp136 [Pleurosigma intermedium]UVG41984.1 hypothetical protein [Pleurosigma intermedium]
MKILRYIIFLSILSGIFILIYRKSDKKGFRRWLISFKMGVVIAAILAGLIRNPVEATYTYNTNATQSVVKERVVETPRGGFRDSNKLSKKQIVSKIREDPGLVRLAEEACNNQRVQDNINHLRDELAKGNDNPGIHKKYFGSNV